MPWVQGISTTVLQLLTLQPKVQLGAYSYTECHSKVSCQLWPGFPDSSVGKESDCNAGALGSTPGLGRCPGEENGNLLQYSCLENPLDRGAWQATVYEVIKSWTPLRD